MEQCKLCPEKKKLTCRQSWQLTPVSTFLPVFDADKKRTLMSVALFDASLTVC